MKKKKKKILPKFNKSNKAPSSMMDEDSINSMSFMDEFESQSYAKRGFDGTNTRKTVLSRGSSDDTEKSMSYSKPCRKNLAYMLDVVPYDDSLEVLLESDDKGLESAMSSTESIRVGAIFMGN